MARDISQRTEIDCYFDKMDGRILYQFYDLNESLVKLIQPMLAANLDLFEIRNVWPSREVFSLDQALDICA